MGADWIKIILSTFAACMAFGFLLHMHSIKQIICAAVGGVFGWGTYLLLAGALPETFCYLTASVVVSIYCELLARLFKAPVTGFLLIGIIPMVPGGLIYYTMEYSINGELQSFAESLMHTFSIAGALAVGVLLVLSGFNLSQKPQSAHKS